LAGDGRFLGMMDPLTLPEYTIQLQPGDRLVLFSDGVTDALNLADEHFDSDRLQEVVCLHGRAPANLLITHIAQAVTQWSQDAAPFDDLTLLVVEARA
jgi:serine phosphatase RsbU (regulator of sigma subunit)